MSILKSSIQPNGLKEFILGNSIGVFEKLLRDEYQRGNVVFQLDTHFLIIVFMDSIIVKVNLLYNKVAQISFYNKFLRLSTMMMRISFIFLILRMRIWLFSLKTLILLRRTTS